MKVDIIYLADPFSTCLVVLSECVHAACAVCVLGGVVMSKPFPEVAGARFVDACSTSRMNDGVKFSGPFLKWCAAQ